MSQYPPGPLTRSPEEVQQILVSHARWPSEHHVSQPQAEFRMTEIEALRMEVRALRLEVVRLHAVLAGGAHGVVTQHSPRIQIDHL